MTLLAAYDRACTALAEITDIGEVLAIRDELAHVKLYARRVMDRELLIEATDRQLRAERHLGVLLQAAKAAGELADRGGVKKHLAEGETRPATLTEIGVDRKLSMTAQRAAALPADAFETLVTATLGKIRSGAAIVVDAIDAPVSGSRAIMASRVEPDDSLDYFPTPPWATRALIERVFPMLGARDDCGFATAWEPACGEGHIAEVLREYFPTVLASDIHAYGYGAVADFLGDEPLYGDRADWIITNPPFGDKGEAFLLRALDLAWRVAIFVRLQWLETEGRYERIFSVKPPTLIAFFAERVNLCKGRWDPEGGTATAYIWLVWIRGCVPRAPFWIAPGCRDDLARADDVEVFTANPVTKRGMPAELRLSEVCA